MLVDNEPPLNQDVHTNFESLVLDSISGIRKIKMRERMYRSKQYLFPKLQSFPVSCTKKAKVQQYLKRWIASKHIHPKNCVRLSAQKGSRDINLLYLVADGNSTPLMVCDACLHIKVIEFRNLELILPSPCTAFSQSISVNSIR